jgi:hypothetical protein
MSRPNEYDDKQHITAAERARRWREANKEKAAEQLKRSREKIAQRERVRITACVDCDDYYGCKLMIARTLQYGPENDPDMVERTKPLPCEGEWL